MDARVKPAPHEIRLARAENPKMRERDLAAQLGISEAALVAADVGDGVIRIEPRVNDLLERRSRPSARCMALTRNESAVHEKIGVYDKIKHRQARRHGAWREHRPAHFPEPLGARLCRRPRRDGDDVRRSLQFFDKAGSAVHKVHLRPASNVDAYHATGRRRCSSRTSRRTSSTTVAAMPTATHRRRRQRATSCATTGASMTDTHQFFGMLKQAEDRPPGSRPHRSATTTPGSSTAARVADHAARMRPRAACRSCASSAMTACIQIHSGPI